MKRVTEDPKIDVGVEPISLASTNKTGDYFSTRDFRRLVGVLLTGMGVDGAEGLLQLKKAGACTIAQDEATSVVYGMPRRALELGAVKMGTPVGRIASQVVSHIGGEHRPMWVTR